MHTFIKIFKTVRKNIEFTIEKRKNAKNLVWALYRVKTNFCKTLKRFYGGKKTVEQRDH